MIPLEIVNNKFSTKNSLPLSELLVRANRFDSVSLHRVLNGLCSYVLNFCHLQPLEKRILFETWPYFILFFLTRGY